VVNVARYYHHKTVRVGGQDDDIFDIRKDLDITKTTNYKTPRSPGMQIDTGKGRTSSRKRSSSCIDAPLPSSKRTWSLVQNHVHRRVITRDYGKPLYEGSSRATMLATLEGCIKGYESSYTRAPSWHHNMLTINLLGKYVQEVIQPLA
jgi:Fungal protein kinase